MTRPCPDLDLDLYLDLEWDLEWDLELDNYSAAADVVKCGDLLFCFSASLSCLILSSNSRRYFVSSFPIPNLIYSSRRGFGILSMTSLLTIWEK